MGAVTRSRRGVVHFETSTRKDDRKAGACVRQLDSQSVARVMLVLIDAARGVDARGIALPYLVPSRRVCKYDQSYNQLDGHMFGVL